MRKLWEKIKKWWKSINPQDQDYMTDEEAQYINQSFDKGFVMKKREKS